MASSAVSFETLAEHPRQLPLLMLRFAFSGVRLQVRSRMKRIGTKFIFGTTLKDNEVSRAIYEDFLPEALADGRYVAAPDPHVVGKGLEHVQAGFDVQMKGVFAKKLVVSL